MFVCFMLMFNQIFKVKKCLKNNVFLFRAVEIIFFCLNRTKATAS